MAVMSKILIRTLCISALYSPALALKNIIVQWDTTSDGPQTTGILDYDFDFNRTSPGAPHAVQIWHKHRTCEVDYFRMNMTNFKESKTDEWYRKVVLRHWAENEHRIATEDGKPGEATYFGETFLGADNFRCNVEMGNCGRPHPSCSSIVEHVRGENPSLPMEQVLEEARRRRFIALTMDELVGTGWQIGDFFTKTEVGLLGEIPTMALYFFPQLDPSAQEACFWANLGLDLGIQVIATGIGMGVGAGLTTAVAKEGTKAGKEAVKTLTTELRQGLRGAGTSGGIEFLFSFMKATMHHRVNNGEGRQFAGLYNVIEKLLEGDLDSLNVATTGPGLCASFGADRPDENFEHAATLSFYISNHFTGLRLMILSGMGSMVNNKNPTNSSMADVFENMSWSTLMSNLRNDDAAALAEINLKQEFRERLIARIWQASHCYIKCDNYPLSQWPLARNDGRNANCGHGRGTWDWKYCRDDDPRTCQIQCWTSKYQDNREMMLFGREVVGKFNLTMEGVFDGALRAWDAGPGTIWSDNYTPANVPSSVSRPLSEISQIAFDNRTSNTLGLGTLNIGNNMDLAVCQSNRGWNIMPLDRCGPLGRLDCWARFPCTCGEWGNMQTKQVMDKIGMGMNSSDYQNSDGKSIQPTLEITCPHVLNTLSVDMGTLTPLENWLEYCNLGIQYPRAKKFRIKGEDFHLWHQVVIARGPHELCQTIEDETKGMTLDDANRHFCNGWSEATNFIINHGEADWLEPGLRYAGYGGKDQWPGNHKTLCELPHFSHYITSDKPPPKALNTTALTNGTRPANTTQMAFNTTIANATSLMNGTGANITRPVADLWASNRTDSPNGTYFTLANGSTVVNGTTGQFNQSGATLEGGMVNGTGSAHSNGFFTNTSASHKTDAANKTGLTFDADASHKGSFGNNASLKLNIVSPTSSEVSKIPSTLNTTISTSIISSNTAEPPSGAKSNTTSQLTKSTAAPSTTSKPTTLDVSSASTSEEPTSTTQDYPTSTQSSDDAEETAFDHLILEFTNGTFANGTFTNGTKWNSTDARNRTSEKKLKELVNKPVHL